MERSDVPRTLWDPTVRLLAAAATTGEVLATGLDELRRLLGADRADGGFLRSRHDAYRPARTVARDGVEHARFRLDGGDPVIGAVMASDAVVSMADLATDAPDGPVRTAMLEIGTRAIVTRRLDVDGAPFGLVCVDWIGRSATPPQEALDLVDIFVRSVLSPTLALAGHGPPSAPGTADRLTDAERDAVRLAAEGCSYSEIAAALGKSRSTIDHQLQAARRRLGARNTAELVRLAGMA